MPYFYVFYSICIIPYYHSWFTQQLFTEYILINAQQGTMRWAVDGKRLLYSSCKFLKLACLSMLLYEQNSVKADRMIFENEQ